MRTRHVGMDKLYVLQAIDRYGAEAVLHNWNGSDEEAKQAVRDDGRDVFCSCDCPKSEVPGRVGGCLGERRRRPRPDLGNLS